YSWSVTNGSITSGQGTNSILVTWGSYPVCGCGSVSVTYTQNGCTGTTVYPVVIMAVSTVNLFGLVEYENPFTTPLNGVTVQVLNASNAVVGTCVTANNPSNGQSGYYSFSNLPNGTYTLHATSNGTWGGNNATDALVVELNIAGQYTFNSLESRTADVNATNTISALDALFILERTVGAITSYPIGEWVIRDTSVTLTGVPKLVNIMALCSGDVNGSYVPVGFKESTSLSRVEDGILTIPVGEPFNYNIRSNKEADLGAMTLFMSYDKDRFEVVDILNKPDGMKYQIKDGKIAIAWSNTNAMIVHPDDMVLSLSMRVKDKITEPVPVFVINGGSEFADVKAKPYDDLALKMADVITPDGAKELTLTNYPNPFANTTTIYYTLPEPGHARLVMTDMLGNTISTLVDKQERAGAYTVTVNPAGLNMAPGVYLYKLIFDSETDTSVKVNKMVFTR
ncbi:MAG: T9SS type A sorting domain-containing protein, partial [Bacteroidota bacterium]